MNKSIMMGRLVRDPEIYYSEGENGELAIVNFRLAVDRKYKSGDDDNEKADFFKCTAFGKLAEFTEKYLFQGIKIIVSGEMRNDNYTNKEGEKVYGTCLILSDIEFAESKAASQRNTDSEESENRSSSNNNQSRSRQAAKGRGDTTGRDSSRRSSGRSDKGAELRGRRNETGSRRERTRRDDPDEEFREMDEYEEDYNFN